MISYILKKVFGSKSARDLKKMTPIVELINKQEVEYQQLSDEELKNKTVEFKKRLQDGETLDEIMVEAFATVKNACRRLCGTEIIINDNKLTWEMVPYDVQIIGGIALHKSNIAEMATGEGKTLVATMPLYLNALTGKNCQLVTVNDYLALRDSEWMGTVYKYLGLTVGCLQNDMPPQLRKVQYNCDITYGTNSEFGFDYLRDMGMATDKDELVQRDYFFVIIDEVDSILIDEARTPLIISGPVANSTHQFESLKGGVGQMYAEQSKLCANLVKKAKDIFDKEDASDDEIDDAILNLVQVRMGMPQHRQLTRILEDGVILKKLEKREMFVRSDQNRGLLQEVQADLYFAMDEKTHNADLTDKGRHYLAPNDQDAFVLEDLSSGLIEIDNSSFSEEEKNEKKIKFQDDFSLKSERLHNLSQLLKAYCLYEKDRHYVVVNNKVVIVDEHTGRQMAGRRFSDGLHQALEAKENTKIERETQTLASITIQNYFRLYEKLSGMTGTAETEAHEFQQIYKLDVIVVPTNRPNKRKDSNDLIYKTKREKYNAILDDVQVAYDKGQPILIGTASVDSSEVVSRFLKARKIQHNVLNAKNHERESEIIAMAGQKGSVTVATNMAGRGTDIKLGNDVVELGGLYVLGSERHDSRRIDRQLRGRCARQGDPGETRFYIALEDNLMRLFGSDKIVKIMEMCGLEEGEELESKWLDRSIETAQKRVEQQHFAVRKHTLEYDDVMNKQREIIYGIRKEALLSDEPKNLLMKILINEIGTRIKDSLVPREGEAKKSCDKEGLILWLTDTFPIKFDIEDLKELDGANPDINKISNDIFDKVNAMYAKKEELEDEEGKIWLERHIVLDAIDRIWQEHLYAMDNLRQSIGLRAYAQKNPLIEYKNEAFIMFSSLMREIYQEILKNMFRSTTSLAAFEEVMHQMPQGELHQEFGQFDQEIDNEPTGEYEDYIEEEEIQIPYARGYKKIQRNDPCPCDSGKKFKKCCGKE